MSKKNLSKNATVAKNSSSKTTTRACSNFSKLGPSRGRVFRNGSGGAAPKFQFRTRSVTVAKNTSGSGLLCFEKLLQVLVLIMPACLFLSYFPVISLGGSASMNYELSVALMWLVVFDIVGLVGMMGKKWRLSGKKLLGRWVWLLFPVWVSLTIIWSLNHMRGILTAGIMWLVIFAGLLMWNYRGLFGGEFRRRWVKWFFGTSLAVCGWCFLQCVLDLAGVPRENSLMCAGCTYQMFGFPHPNGFAIEPQFMGNLLLAPAIVCAWMMTKKQINKIPKLGPSRGRVFRNGSGGAAPKFQFRTRSVTVAKNTSGSGLLCFGILLICFLIITSTLFLTFSRGAIYAFVVGMMFLSGFVVFRERKEMRREIWRRVGMVWGAVVLSFLFTLNLQGMMAAVSPTNDTYFSGISKVVNQLTLGVIDIRGEDGAKTGADASEENEVLESGEDELKSRGDGIKIPTNGNSKASDTNNMSGEGNKKVIPQSDMIGGGEGINGALRNNMVEKKNGTESVFDGYVEESTGTRVRLNDAAIQIWSKDLKNAVLGVGLGGAGQALYNDGLSPAPKEIIQNEYFSLLLETGVVGLILGVLMAALFIRKMIRGENAGMVLALMVAYGVSLMFFSGLPNALHIYLLLALFGVVGFGAKDATLCLAE